MLPLLQTSQAARIVTVSSGLGSLTQNGNPSYLHAAAKLIGYCASKAACNSNPVVGFLDKQDESFRRSQIEALGGFTRPDKQRQILGRRSWFPTIISFFSLSTSLKASEKQCKLAELENDERRPL